MLLERLGPVSRLRERFRLVRSYLPVVVVVVVDLHRVVASPQFPQEQGEGNGEPTDA